MISLKSALTLSTGGYILAATALTGIIGYLLYKRYCSASEPITAKAVVNNLSSKAISCEEFNARSKLSNDYMVDL